MIVPGAMGALRALSTCTQEDGVPIEIRDLVHLRASQINGCSVCVDMHARDLRRAGESDERLFAVAAWRDAPYFTDAERAAANAQEIMPDALEHAGAIVEIIPDRRLQSALSRLCRLVGGKMHHNTEAPARVDLAA